MSRVVALFVLAVGCGCASSSTLKQRLFMTVATTRESCAGCSLMALAIYLPPDEARAWRQTVAGPGRRAIKGR